MCRQCRKGHPTEEHVRVCEIQSIESPTRDEISEYHRLKEKLGLPFMTTSFKFAKSSFKWSELWKLL
jgi:hypothetical protein